MNQSNHSIGFSPLNTRLPGFVTKEYPRVEFKMGRWSWYQVQPKILQHSKNQPDSIYSGLLALGVTNPKSNTIVYCEQVFLYITKLK